MLISCLFFFFFSQPGNYFPVFITSLKGVEAEGACKLDSRQVYLPTLVLLNFLVLY